MSVASCCWSTSPRTRRSHVLVSSHSASCLVTVRQDACSSRARRKPFGAIVLRRGIERRPLPTHGHAASSREIHVDDRRVVYDVTLTRVRIGGGRSLRELDDSKESSSDWSSMVRSSEAAGSIARRDSLWPHRRTQIVDGAGHESCGVHAVWRRVRIPETSMRTVTRQDAECEPTRMCSERVRTDGLRGPDTTRRLARGERR